MNEKRHFLKARRKNRDIIRWKVPPVVIRSLRYFEVLNLNLAVSLNMGSIFSLEYTI